MADLVRIKADRAFRAPVNGVMGVVEVGDVIEAAKDLASFLRSSNKGHVTTEPVGKARHAPDKSARVAEPMGATSSGGGETKKTKDLV